MRNNSLKTDIITDEIMDILSVSEEDITEIKEKFKRDFPLLKEEYLEDLAMIISRLYQKNKVESVEIVSTTPVSFRTKNRKTYPVLKEMITSAQKNITLTGYSISDHFDDLLDLIHLKSKQGITVELFLNNYNETKHIFKDINISNRSFFKVYSYSGIDGDEMASLHAKTMIVDEHKVFISSANLSYHGMVSNIEIGVMIDSKTKALQVLDIFKELKRTKKFIQVDFK
jgi:phosphatidylserine/phosphatidylglycerophosphate/cardiolipin synthase-like enzyme